MTRPVGIQPEKVLLNKTAFNYFMWPLIITDIERFTDVRSRERPLLELSGGAAMSHAVHLLDPSALGLNSVKPKMRPEDKDI